MPAPTPTERIPARDKNRFDCPHCSTYAKQTWFPLWHRAEGGGFSEALDRFEAVSTDNGTTMLKIGVWASAQCDACNDHSTWRDDELVYPRASGIVPPAADMPPKVVELYNEARDVMAVSRRAGAALARATMELLVKTLYPEGTGQLADRLGDIIPKVSSSLGAMLTVIRHVGNKSLHVEEVPDDAVVLVLDEEDVELVGVMFESINELVDEVVTKPAAAKKFLDLVPERVKKNVPGLGS